MTIDECSPNQKLWWKRDRSGQGILKAARVLAVTGSRVVVLVYVRGQAVRRAVRPARLYRTRKSATVQN